MTTLEHFVSPALTRAMGWTLLHSLWQGALVAAVLAGALLLLRRQRAEVRYLAAASALGLVVALAGITFGLYFTVKPPKSNAPAPVAEQASPLQPAQTRAAATGAAAAQLGNVVRAVPADGKVAAHLFIRSLAQPGPAAPHWLATGLQYFDHHLPLLVVAWLLGLLAMALRMLGGLLYVQRLRRYRVRPLGAGWQDRLTALAARSGLRRPVALLESALVQVPLVVGHVRPVILLPLGAVAGLPAAYLEAILAHELAHVLRRDYLVNLLQTVAEVLFFYHPAVWFVANCVRTERENCCDDTATALIGGDSLRLARALTALAEWSQSAVVPVAPRLALAAIGRRGALMGRVRRLVQRRPAAPTLAEGLIAGALVLGGLGLLGSSVALAGPLALHLPAQSPRAMADQDTTKRRLATAPPPQDSSAAKGRPGPQQPAGKAHAKGPDGITEPDAQPDPEAMGKNGSHPHPSPGTVVITKDKKGRLTDLVVNGQPVPAATAALSKADRRAGRQVTVVPLPPAPRRRHFTFDYSRSVDEQGNEQAKERAREFDRSVSKAERELDEAGRKLDKSAKTYVYVNPGPGHRRSGGGSSFHFDIDDNALNQLTANALALGNVSLNFGLQAAAQGLEEARRELEKELRNPNLDANSRREVNQALRSLKRGRAKARHNERLGAPERPETLEQLEAEDRAEVARERAEELRERRQEIQERIQEAQEELRELEENRREAQETSAVPPMPPAPQAPQAPQAPRAARPPLPPAPPRAPVDNSGKVRDELRRDGLIGKNDKSFRFQLNDEGLKVNGQRQSAELATKYRQLLSVPGQSAKRTGKGNTSTNINISVQAD